MNSIHETMMKYLPDEWLRSPGKGYVLHARMTLRRKKLQQRINTAFFYVHPQTPASASVVFRTILVRAFDSCTTHLSLSLNGVVRTLTNTTHPLSHTHDY
ncbi:MAG: hypothetical protein JNL32_02635 [Candidatus Kapabacteria bacterium]|nr:hypothetical protein [Candidatus Kapabacteria bacterium]